MAKNSVPRRKLERKFPDVESFIKKNRSIIYGTLLGDSAIPNSGEKNTMMEFSHGPDQKDYLFHKFKLFEEVSYPPSFGSYESGDRWYFHTVKHPAWQEVRSVFHAGSAKRTRSGRTYTPKVMSQEILNALDDHGVALWIMDDGNLSFWANQETRQWREYAKIAVCDFTFDEAELAASWFRGRYGADCKVERQKSQSGTHYYPLIYFSWQEYLKIAIRIRPFVPECMGYKIDIQAARIWAERGLLNTHGVFVVRK